MSFFGTAGGYGHEAKASLREQVESQVARSTDAEQAVAARGLAFLDEAVDDDQAVTMQFTGHIEPDGTGNITLTLSVSPVIEENAVSRRKAREEGAGT